MQWFLNISTRSKIVSCFTLMFALILVVILTAYFSITATTASQQELYARNYRATVDVVDIRSDQNRVRLKLLEMMMTSDRTKLSAIQQEVKERSDEVDKTLKDLAIVEKNDLRFMSWLQELISTCDTYKQSIDEKISLIMAGKLKDASQLSFGQQDQLYNKIREITHKLQDYEVAQAKQKLADSDQRAFRSLIIFMIVSILSLIFSFTMTVAMNSAIAKPLVEVSAIAEKIADGEVDVVIPAVRRNDEVGLLIQMFMRMIENVKGYALVTKRIAGGDLSFTYTPKSDRDVMGTALAVMANNLRDINRELIDGINVLASSSSEIIASTAQVTASAAESAVAVSETTTTVEEVKQTAQLASQKARAVSDSSQNAVHVSQSGRKAVNESIAGMHHIKQQVESIAESIVRLSEQSQAIGDIISTVNDLAEQSNLLAVNAAIEAAKAGDQGKGFAVVAQEVKSLAEQSKEATAHVRTILNDIQKATNAAVMATEEGNKAVETGVRQFQDAGESIRLMSESIDESAQVAIQIAASSQQQLAGMDQVAVAMENIKVGSDQNVTGMKQVETTVQGLHDLGQRLKRVAEQFRV